MRRSYYRSGEKKIPESIGRELWRFFKLGFCGLRLVGAGGFLLPESGVVKRYHMLENQGEPVTGKVTEFKFGEVRPQTTFRPAHAAGSFGLFGQFVVEFVAGRRTGAAATERDQADGTTA